MSIDEIKLPLSLLSLEGGVTGVRYEIFPLLLKKVNTQQELNTFGENMMDVISNRYDLTLSGSVLWIIYKKYCEKDIKVFLKCANTLKKQTILISWLFDNFKG